MSADDLPKSRRFGRIIFVVEDTKERANPLMMYDGDCGFCRRWIARWKAMTGDRIDYAPYQSTMASFPQLSREELSQAVHLVEPGGEVYYGAHAVFRALAQGAGKRWPLRLYRHVPGVAPVTELTYRFVASHRYGFSRITSWLWGAELGPPSFLLTRWLFIRLIGVIYLIAFVSLGVQILGLVGSDGILPAADFLERARHQLGDEATWRLPTLAWYRCTDDFLQLLCWGGAATSVLVILRIAPALMLLLCWVLYLSLYYVGQTFLSFQWDILLLETGLLAIFYAPWSIWPRLKMDRQPSRVIRWLIILLLFRLMFSSGIVKILDDSPSDPTWHNLTALTYHYATTCLPNTVSWYAHQLPIWFHKFSCVAMFVIEIGVPFLFFAPRRPRLIAFWVLVLFQVLIIATGNYNFFNLLTIVLCLPLVDDAFLRRFQPGGRRVGVDVQPQRRKVWLVQRLCILAFALPILFLNVFQMRLTLREDRRSRAGSIASELPRPLQELIRVSRRYHFVSGYGLFRSMTTRRPEIIIEGSNDQRNWKAYEFKWKPGDPKRRPLQVAPHQPRLDWQMWFAALGTYRQGRNRWFISLERRLLEGSSSVLALLEHNPFPDDPPRYIRAVLYDYHFSDWETRRSEGVWWTRERLRLYAPVLSLDSFRR